MCFLIKILVFSTNAVVFVCVGESIIGTVLTSLVQENLMIVADTLTIDEFERISTRTTFSVYIENFSNWITCTTVFKFIVKEEVLRTNTFSLLLVWKRRSRTGMTLPFFLYVCRFALANSVLSHETLVANASLRFDPNILISFTNVSMVSIIATHQQV